MTLGGFREGACEEWMSSGEFAGGLGELERLAGSNVAAFMCAEGVPGRCHRRFVSRALVARGHRVSHLLPDGRTVSEANPLELPDQ